MLGALGPSRQVAVIPASEDWASKIHTLAPENGETSGGRDVRRRHSGRAHVAGPGQPRLP